VTDPLRLLVVEDSPGDALLLTEQLADSSLAAFEVAHVESLNEATEHLESRVADCVLLDLSLPDVRGLDALVEVRRTAPEAPVIVLVSAGDEDTGSMVVKHGAQDFVVTGRTSSAALARAVRDAIERKQDELGLGVLGTHDVLTALPNRTLLLDRIKQAVKRSSRRGTPLAVGLLALDRAALRQERVGDRGFDRLVVEVARRLSANLRPSDTVARLTADRFAVLAEDLTSEQAATNIGDRMAAAVVEPFAYEGRTLLVTANIGIALAVDATDRPESLLQRADAALVRSRERGTEYEILGDGPATAGAAARRVNRHVELEQALQDGQLVLHYQPQVSLTKRTSVVGVEALVRWRDPERGLIPPEQFLPFAEQSGLIAGIGAWTLREACDQLQRWGVDGRVADDCRVAVNVSGAQLVQPEFIESVTRVLRETGLEPSRLCLEIPESALVADLDRLERHLASLKGLGVTLAIDRFGATMASSLHALGRLPIDLLKFDRSFVLALGDGPRSRALLEGLIALAHAMDMTPLAQGVQLDSEDLALRELGGDEAQGFRYSPPRPAEALDEVLGPGGGRRRGRRGAIRVFLCDDIAEMRDMVRVALEQEPDFEVVGEASDGEGAARGVAETHPDVVVLDVSMPHVDGLEAIRRIRASGEDTAILVLSGFERQAMADTAIGLGADAYLEKRAALDEIRDTLRSVVTARAGVA
jgi:diguanylate cyclase (GGDEF)-like protein